MDDIGLAYCKIPKENVKTYTFFRELYFYFMDVYTSQFAWEVPLTCDNRTIERSLFFNGSVLIFQDNTNRHWYSLPFVGEGLNIYDNPVRRQVVSHIGKTWIKTALDSVIVWDSFNRIPPVYTVVDRASLLAEIKSAMLVNVNAQKTPWFLRGTQRQMDTLKALYKKIENNSAVLFGDKDLDLQTLSVFNTEAPERYLTLFELYERIFKDTLNMLVGIPTTNTWKKERLVGDEATSSDPQALASRMSRYRCRKEAVKKLRLLAPDFAWNVYYTGEEDGGIYGGLHDNSITDRTGDNRTD